MMQEGKNQSFLKKEKKTSRNFFFLMPTLVTQPIIGNTWETARRRGTGR